VIVEGWSTKPLIPHSDFIYNAVTDKHGAVHPIAGSPRCAHCAFHWAERNIYNQPEGHAIDTTAEPIAAGEPQFFEPYERQMRDFKL